MVSSQSKQASIPRACAMQSHQRGARSGSPQYRLLLHVLQVASCCMHYKLQVAACIATWVGTKPGLGRDWTGLDHGLDYGLNYGPDFGLDFRVESKMYELTSHFQAF